MEDNTNLKLIINYLGKSSEIKLDDNISFEQEKLNIAKELNISDEDKNNIFVKFFDIKYEKLSQQANYYLKLELFNNEQRLKLDSQNKNDENEISALQKDIESFRNEMNSINELYENNIKQLQNNFGLFKKDIDKVDDELKIKDGDENKNDNLYADKNEEIFNLINQIKNEIKEIKENNIDIDEINEINENDKNDNEIQEDENNKNNFYETLEKFKKTYQLENLGIGEEEIRRVFHNKGNDYFDTMSELIVRSYKKHGNIKDQPLIDFVLKNIN